MRRINSLTAEVDKFGTGAPGCTDGDVGMGIPPTQLNAQFFDNFQEEIARTVEGGGFVVVASGAPLGDDNFFQLDDTVQQHVTSLLPQSQDSGSVQGGLRLTTSVANFNTTVLEGIYRHLGRRYHVTAAKLLAHVTDPIVVTASRDTYYFIAFEDPGAPTTPPDRSLVHVEIIGVPNNDPAPAPPGSTFLFAVAISDGVGVQSVRYPNHGVVIGNQNGSSVDFRRPGGVSVEMEIAPTTNIDLGVLVDEHSTVPLAGAVFRSAALGRVNLRTVFSSLNPAGIEYKYTQHATTLGGGSDVALTILDTADFSEATTVQIFIRVAAFDATDPTDGYSAAVRLHAHIDGGIWDLDGSVTVVFEDGNGALVAGVALSASLDGTGNLIEADLQVHSTDLLRWFVSFTVLISGP